MSKGAGFCLNAFSFWHQKAVHSTSTSAELVSGAAYVDAPHLATQLAVSSVVSELFFGCWLSSAWVQRINDEQRNSSTYQHPEQQPSGALLHVDCLLELHIATLHVLSGYQCIGVQLLGLFQLCSQLHRHAALQLSDFVHLPLNCARLLEASCQRLLHQAGW